MRRAAHQPLLTPLLAALILLAVLASACGTAAGEDPSTTADDPAVQGGTEATPDTDVSAGTDGDAGTPDTGADGPAGAGELLLEEPTTAGPGGVALPGPIPAGAAALAQVEFVMPAEGRIVVRCLTGGTGGVVEVSLDVAGTLVVSQDTGAGMVELDSDRMNERDVPSAGDVVGLSLACGEDDEDRLTVGVAVQAFALQFTEATGRLGEQPWTFEAAADTPTNVTRAIITPGGR